jgi:hypothetical protein
MQFIGSDERTHKKQKKRSYTWSTRWFSITLDWGVTLRGVQDEFKQLILRRGWGVIFNSRKVSWLYFSTPHPEYVKERKYWIDLKRIFDDNTSAIKAGTRKHPAMMNVNERHLATAELAQKMKWSKTFVQAMTTPMALRALEAGGTVTNEWGDELRLSPEEMKALNREEFQRLRLEWKRGITTPPLFKQTEKEISK